MVNIVLVESVEGTFSQLILSDPSHQHQFKRIRSLKEGKLVLLGFKVARLRFDVGVQHAHKVGHCGRCGFKVTDAVTILKLVIVDLFLKLLRVNVVEQALVLEYHEFVNSSLHSHVYQLLSSTYRSSLKADLISNIIVRQSSLEFITPFTRYFCKMFA